MKTTMATIKKFMRDNKENLYIKTESTFDGMVDMVTNVKDNFRKVEGINEENRYTFGIVGAWFVGRSRDYFSDYSDENYKGFEVYNCCGSFIIAKPV